VINAWAFLNYWGACAPAAPPKSTPMSIVTLQVHCYSETQHGYCVGVSRRSATGNSASEVLPQGPDMY